MSQSFDVKATTKLAESGDAESQLVLGDYYSQHPNEARRDYDLAKSLYERSFESGRALAAYRVGEMYEKGMGCIEDPKSALEWYESGSDLGCVACSAKLMFVYAKGQLGVNQNDARAEFYQSRMQSQSR